MGRKRKTRWRRLSIGEASGNEEEEVHEMNGDGDVSVSRVRSASQLSLNNSSHGDTPTMSSKASLAEVYPKEGGGGGSRTTPPTQCEENGGSGENSHHHHNQSSHHQYHNGHHHSSYYSNHYNKDRGGGDRGEGGHSHSHSNGGSYHNGGGGGHHHGNSNGNGYYQNSYYQRNNYNNYRNTHYDSRNGGGGDGGYQQGGGGGSDYNYSQASRYGGGRYRKPRSYSSNYYYNNGTSGAQQGDTTNRPSYPDEYTKITTPRQDVLFKKGYLSQRKPAAQSSVDSTSSTTTPSASTNGTPDTHSTNGVNSDYSEGYENGETDCGIPPYDDTVYYGPPAEAVFTDPNTGQVYYGQCSSNGEYFDAYPVSSVVVAGYPTAPVYYQLSYPPIDWNGVPNPFVQAVCAQAPLPLLEDQLSPGLQGAESQSQTNQSRPARNGEVEEVTKKTGENTRTSPPPTAGSPTPSGKRGKQENGAPPAGDGVTKQKQKGPTGAGPRGSLGSSFSSASSTVSSSSSPSSLASTPMSPPSGGGHHHHHSLTNSMSNLSLGTTGGSPSHLHHHPHVLPHFLANVPPPPNHAHGPQPPPFIYQHPQAPAFVYAAAPTIYNGVVVPIAPTASAAADLVELVEISSNTSRKKRKKRRRKKDGQLTDESSEEDGDDDDSASMVSNNDERGAATSEKSTTSESINDKTKELSLKIIDLVETTPESDEQGTVLPEAEAKPKDLTCDEESKPEIIENLVTKTEFTVEISSVPQTDNQEVANDKDEKTSAVETAEIDNPAVEAENSNQVASTDVEVVTTGESSTSVPVTSTTTTTQGKSLSLRKPVDLTVLCPFNSLNSSASNDLQLLSLQRSPDGLEPSSPDSLNTNQSVAGSEIASVSESDFMNRTTSLDEVEDLPIEGILEEQIESKVSGTTSSSVQSNDLAPPDKIAERKMSSEKVESGVSKNIDVVVRSEPVKRDPTLWDTSPSFTPSESTEPSPSPETIFERQIEPPPIIDISPSTAVTEDVPEEPIPTDEFRSLSADPTLESQSQQDNESGLSSPTLESHTQSIISPLEEDAELQFPEVTEEIVTAETSPIIEVAQSQSKEPEPPDIPETPPITQEAIEKLSETLQTVEASQRPTSITLAVSEWLKAQGDDALTPVSQLHAQLAEVEQDVEGDGDDEEDDEESIQENEESENSDQNQKNVHGNPWVVPSNKSGAARESRLTGLKELRSKGNVSADGICSRVACRVSTASSSSNTRTMTMTTQGEVDYDKNLNEDVDVSLTDEDSGFEHSSPEVSPAKGSTPKKNRGKGRNPLPTTKQDDPMTMTMTEKNPSSNISCDPQKFTKYYQFGVVFDEKDQGIEVDESILIPSDGDKDAFVNGSVTCRKVMLTCDFDEEDEEVGTFVPKIKNFEGFPKSRATIRRDQGADGDATFVQKDKTAKDAVAGKAQTFSHLYVNPFSLAIEMEMEEDDPIVTPYTVPPDDFFWDDEAPLPPYESPSPVEYPTPPVFSHMTPNAKLIRTHQDQLGSLIPIPRAICCVIQ